MDVTTIGPSNNQFALNLYANLREQPAALRRREPKPVIFRADHPFLFVIRHVRTNSILFIGRVTDPRKGRAQKL